jgi:sulfur carrier protein
MNILVNGQPRAVPEGCTLHALLEMDRTGAQAVATAVNGEFVPRDARAAHALHDGDAVTFFEPITGG